MISYQRIFSSYKTLKFHPQINQIPQILSMSSSEFAPFQLLLPNPLNRNNLIRKNPVRVVLRSMTIHSITIISLIYDSNRLKFEIYNGFSHVFSSISSQDEVYDNLMRPIVEGFMSGKGGLSAALGPSCSWKIHTVFGSIKVPGLVPRALRHIFYAEVGRSSMMSSLCGPVGELLSKIR